jgi:hypothetical protein
MLNSLFHLGSVFFVSFVPLWLIQQVYLIAGFGFRTTAV